MLTSELVICNKLCLFRSKPDDIQRRLITAESKCRYAMESAQLACDVAYAGVEQGSILGGRL